MQKIVLSVIFLFVLLQLNAQTPKSYSASDILQLMKKLPVTPSVLYIAAHPDDENTRLLGYLANEKKYRTGYLSLTRGDGGQNLIGDEQGIDLGLIRTQELLAARRIDGAEQFFSRAYDFGFSKSPQEALDIWGHDKILSDVVWVIRKFRPDVIITRFPTTGEGGHGHHTASAILAGEAFDAAADPGRFPEQLKYVSVWQAKRLLWNTFNFGGNNTTREDQLKVDCGNYNSLLGKSYGEIAAESRSQHKSQGFGVPAQRGSSLEYFANIKGDKAADDLMNGIDTSWMRIGNAESGQLIQNLLNNYKVNDPSASVPSLIDLYSALDKQGKTIQLAVKLEQVKTLIEACSGLFMEATSNNQLISIGDTARLNMSFINRSDIDLGNSFVQLGNQKLSFRKGIKNEAVSLPVNFVFPDSTASTQPYWLRNKMDKGAFNVDDQQQIGMAQNEPLKIKFIVSFGGKEIAFEKPLLFKFTDPVKGEIYEPVQLIPPVFVNSNPSLILFRNGIDATANLHFTLQTNTNISQTAKYEAMMDGKPYKNIFDSILLMNKGMQRSWDLPLRSSSFADKSTSYMSSAFSTTGMKSVQVSSLKKISYDHIPDVFYTYTEQAKIIKLDLKTSGSRAGYIPGAGDKVPDALLQMGYTVTILSEKDMTTPALDQFDVIVTGVRAYNIHDWLNRAYPVLMKYVENGGVLFVQYNTNNSIGPVKASIAPYPFTISRNRVTDEKATVKFLLPSDDALNFPNKITDKDFEGWIQERSTYHAEAVDPHYKKILSMQDPGEPMQDGSLISTAFGKGRFVYSGLVFFRELPAGVAGAYRLFANLIANRKKN